MRLLSRAVSAVLVVRDLPHTMPMQGHRLPAKWLHAAPEPLSSHCLGSGQGKRSWRFSTCLLTMLIQKQHISLLFTFKYRKRVTPLRCQAGLRNDLPRQSLLVSTLGKHEFEPPAGLFYLTQDPRFSHLLSYACSPSKFPFLSGLYSHPCCHHPNSGTSHLTPAHSHSRSSACLHFCSMLFHLSFLPQPDKPSWTALLKCHFPLNGSMSKQQRRLGSYLCQAQY